ncbi:protein inturned isoform X4 [Gadus chalcogrammus]|uniref:protein inturned isoform X4 n=1 Tax=Gadus chalcogrammus TaxID=1042646 RepID=UPI0024C4B909|nr:protein inturned isoform X4 [Gadus chalcogrammus]
MAFSHESETQQGGRLELINEIEGESTSSSYNSDYSVDLEPEWLDNVQKNGELFYLELSEGEEEVALARAHGNCGLSTNHVRFSDKEAEVITEADQKQCSDSPTKAEPKLKKLARLLRRKRSSKRRGQENEAKDGGSLPASILKTQAAAQRQGGAVRQVKEVCVYVNPKRLAPLPDGGGGLLASLLGLVHRPCSGRGPGNPAAAGEGETLTVHGLVPNSPAIRGGQILIGDVLVAVDDVEVTTESIERVLSCIPGPTQVRLTLETSAPAEGPPTVEETVAPPLPRAKAPPPVSQLVRLLWGEDTAELQMALGHVPHVAMYLSLQLDSETLQEEQEILYQYPVSDASSQLKGVRGVFLTLCDMLENVTGGHIVSSSLLLGRHLVHVGYWKEGSRLLVLGIPAESVPLLYLQTVLGGVVRTLQVMYGSLDSAFCRADHGPRLDHFFCLFFQQLLRPSRLTAGGPGAPPPPAPQTPDAPGSLFLEGLPAVRWLSLPPEIKTLSAPWCLGVGLEHPGGLLVVCVCPQMEVDTVLSDFESSDFGELSEDFFGLRRLYMILGSCLFYKGYLIANHLPREDLLDVCLYCQHYGLLPLASEQRVGQLVVWREVFPLHRGQQRAPGAAGPSAAAAEARYAPPRARHFLLIVGLRHLMQCVLMEAGGAASPALGSPGPDCIYIDQVKATLLQLEGLEGGMEDRLSAPTAPCLSCADWFLPGAASARDRSGAAPSSSSSSPVLSKLAGAMRGPSLAGARGRGLFGDRARQPSPRRNPSDSGNDGPQQDPGPRRDSLGSGGSDGSGSLFKIPRMKNPNPFYLGTLKKTLTERETEDMFNSIKLTSGVENTLFHYVLMESVQGIFIAPTHRQVAQLSGSIHPQLIRNFHHCCLSIRAAFQQSLPPRGPRGAAERARGPLGLGPVKEHGVLFQCKPQNWKDQKKPAPTMTYWVIGRMLLEPVPQEFYVCFHDSVPEVPVELAFRLSFGLAL